MIYSIGVGKIMVPTLAFLPQVVELYQLTHASRSHLLNQTKSYIG